MFKYHRFKITFLDYNGDEVTKTVDARNGFEAMQLAGALDKKILEFVNLDL